AAGSAVLPLARTHVPTGEVLVTGSAFDVACSEVTTQHPTWLAAGVSQRLEPGVGASFTLVFHPNGEASVSVSFVGAPPAAGTPDDAICLRVAAVGATRTGERTLALTGAPLALSDLPSGDVLFTADAYAAPCAGLTPASARSWFGTPVAATLTPGEPAS